MVTKTMLPSSSSLVTSSILTFDSFFLGSGRFLNRDVLPLVVLLLAVNEQDYTKSNINMFWES